MIYHLVYLLYNGILEQMSSTTIHRGHAQRMVRFQKLLQNVFLTLHGHKVHSQQRDLSKSLMRYQQFASLAYCAAARPVCKMASKQEKAFCLFRVEASRSVITVQRGFHARFKKDAPHKNNPLLAWHWRSLIRFSEPKRGSTTHLIWARKD
jgi:hypothetical protein